jgi:S1-C subfamily serine protease
MSNTLIALSNELAAAVERASKSVVAVHGHPRIPSSGVLWKPGIIVTAEHTLRRDDEVQVTFPDGKTAKAAIAGRDAGTDLAVLKVDHPHTVEIDETPRTGDLALAVGRTQNTGVSAVMGVISGVGGEWNTWRGGRLDQFIRLDLRLYPGLSGGAVINAAGKLTGIATAGLSRSSPLSIPVATIQRVTKDLIEKGHVAHGYLGIGLQPVALPEHLNSSARGLIVLSVEKDGPGSKAGLVMGDILVALDGKPVTDTDDVQAVLSSDFVGKTLRASILRGGEPKDVAMVVGERPHGRVR